MGEHRIRLRGPWEIDIEEGPEAGKPARVTLPIEWPPGVKPKFRLHRRFGRPTLDPGRDAVRLELAMVPGLVSAWVNDQEVARLPRDVLSWSVPLERPLLPRNDLVLIVDLGGIAVADLPGDWGSIELAIVSRDE